MAESLDLEMYQGDTFRWVIYVQDSAGVPVNLVSTSAIVRGKIRKSYDLTTNVYTFTSYIDPDQTTNTGKVTLSFTDEETATFPKGSYKYDVEVEISGETHKIYRGAVVVFPEATK